MQMSENIDIISESNVGISIYEQGKVSQKVLIQ